MNEANIETNNSFENKDKSPKNAIYENKHPETYAAVVKAKKSEGKKQTETEGSVVKAKEIVAKNRTESVAAENASNSETIASLEITMKNTNSSFLGIINSLKSQLDAINVRLNQIVNNPNLRYTYQQSPSVYLQNQAALSQIVPPSLLMGGQY